MINSKKAVPKIIYRLQYPRRRGNHWLQLLTSEAHVADLFNKWICTDGVVVESALFQLPMWLMQALEESIHWLLISCNSTDDYVSWFFSFWYTLSEALITSTTSRCIFYTLSSANPFSRILLADDDFYTQDGCHVCLQTPIGHLVSAYSLISPFVLFPYSSLICFNSSPKYYACTPQADSLPPYTWHRSDGCATSCRKIGACQDSGLSWNLASHQQNHVAWRTR